MLSTTLASLLAVVAVVHAQMHVTSKTTNGTVEGIELDGVIGYLGVPFAAPPVGKLRFQPPVAHPGWSGILDASKVGRKCVQGAGPAPPHGKSLCGAYCKDHGYAPDDCGCGVCGSFGGCSFSCNAVKTSAKHPLHKCPPKPHAVAAAATPDPEDCLTVNVFTPVCKELSCPPKPIMFYIHGGGFVGGHAATAWNLTRYTGHVVVAIQYRLGVVGFFSTGDTPDNFGMQDQAFALRWTRDNAKAFGGDPSKIIIFGCSAGGASVAGHLVNPALDGLYSAAGIESPGGHQGWMPTTDSHGHHTRSDDDWMSTKLNLRNSEELALSLNCTGAHDVKCLQALPLSAIYGPSRQSHFAPSQATEGDYPLGLIRRGKWNKVPTIIGGQSCESCNSAHSRFGLPSKTVTDAEFRKALIAAGFSGTNGSLVDPDTLETWYAKRIAAEGRWRTFARIGSDSGHACSSTLHAEALGMTSAAVWRYFFDYVRPGPFALPGATHGGDETWLFDTKVTTSADELTISHDMATWWANLATSGDPNVGAKASVIWDTFTGVRPAAYQKAMFIQNPPAMNQSIDTVRTECAHWKPYAGW